jgi:ribosomal-protein-alanine N-acetyltransferase
MSGCRRWTIVVNVGDMDIGVVELRPVLESDLDFLCRFRAEPGLIGANWYGFRDAGKKRRRFQSDGWLGDEDGKLIVSVGGEVVGFVGWTPCGQTPARGHAESSAPLPNQGWRFQEPPMSDGSAVLRKSRDWPT